MEVVVLPGLDRAGPLGMGPMTGRGSGNCNYYARTRFLSNGSLKNRQLNSSLLRKFIWLVPGVIFGIHYLLSTKKYN